MVLRVRVGVSLHRAAVRGLLALAVFFSPSVNSGEVSVERHEHLAATQYSYASNDCWISLTRHDSGSKQESWVDVDKNCSLNMAVQSGLLAVLLAEMKNSGQLLGVRAVGWGGIWGVFGSGSPDLLRRVAVASTNSPAWTALTENNRKTRLPKTPRETREVVNDPAVFAELRNVLAAMGFRLTVQVHEGVVVRRAADVPALRGLAIPGESVVPLLGVWLEIEESESEVGGRFAHDAESRGNARAEAVGTGLESRDASLDAVRYSYLSDDCWISLILRDPESREGGVLSVETACTLDFAVQAGLSGILIAELKNAGRLDGIRRIHWADINSPNVARRLALAFHGSPEWAEFIRTKGISGTAGVSDPNALQILDRSGVFREFVSLLESFGMEVEVLSERLSVNRAGELRPLAGLGLPDESLVPRDATVSFILRGNGDGGS